MRVSLYLSIIGVVLVLGFITASLRDKEATNVTTFYHYITPPQQFIESATRYAEMTRAGSIDRWELYGGYGEAIVADGLNRQGQLIIKCVFDKTTIQPLSIQRPVWTETLAFQKPEAKSPRTIAKRWLNHIFGTAEGKWRRMSGNQIQTRYQSVWRSAQFDATLMIDTKTGKMIYLRLVPCDDAFPHGTGS